MRPNGKTTEQPGEDGGLYIHVPFCKTKCPYCDFYSVTDFTLVERWLRALSKEMELYRDEFGIFDTLYVGGGTPTALGDVALGSLFENLHRQYAFREDTEITVEGNPDDITPGKLELLKSLGVNRLSIGAQSFNDEQLAFLQRRHSRQGTVRALSLVNASEFNNFGIDLMYGLPGQTVDDWTASLHEALQFQPKHISCYQLTIEETTPFGRMVEQKKFQLCDEEQGRRFFLITSALLQENGFIHYEISNFAKGNEFRSRHNGKYWRHVPYLGLGPGAHSFNNGVRWWNVRSVESYCTYLKKRLPPREGLENLTLAQLRLEKLFLGLRTCDGISLDCAFPRNTALEHLDGLLRTGLLRLRGNRVVPTTKGLLMADRLPLLFP